jgi:hypothetical protein
VCLESNAAVADGLFLERRLLPGRPMRLGDATRKRKRSGRAWLIAGALFVFSIVTLGVGVFHTSTAPVHGKRFDSRRGPHGKGWKARGGGKAGGGGRKQGSRRAADAEARPEEAQPADEDLLDAPTAPQAAYVLATFKDNKVMGDGLRFLVSTDGMEWEAVGPEGDDDAQLQLRREDIPGAKVFRDPSMLFHDGWFHLVFSSELCVFQVARTPSVHVPPWALAYNPNTRPVEIFLSFFSPSHTTTTILC